MARRHLPYASAHSAAADVSCLAARCVCQRTDRAARPAHREDIAFFRRRPSGWPRSPDQGTSLSYQSVDPNTGKVVKNFDHLDTAQLQQALGTAQTCFQRWKNTSYADRAAVLSRAAVLLCARVDDFARLATLEMGKRLGEARGASSL